MGTRPSLTFCTSIEHESFSWQNVETATVALKAKRLTVAKAEMNAANGLCFEDGQNAEYAYAWTYTRATEILELELVACCGEEGPIFPGTMELEEGYTLAGGDVSEDESAEEHPVPAVPGASVVVVKVNMTTVLMLCALMGVVLVGCLARSRLSARGKGYVMPTEQGCASESESEVQMIVRE